MNKDIIGIKLSDGSFYPVLTAGKQAEKQLKLTTARDGQTSIRLHLYRSSDETMNDAEYIDSLRIDNLNYHVMNEPTISLTVSSDMAGNISAQLEDPETGTRSSKTVSIGSFPSPVAEDAFPEIEDMPDIPDFDLDLAIPEPKPAEEFDIPPLTEEDLDFGFDDDEIRGTGSIVSDFSTDFDTSTENEANDDFSMQTSPFTDASLFDDPETTSKKSSVSIPLAICILCAVICLCVLGIMFFVSPPKWLSKNTTEAPEYEFDGQLIPDQTEEDVPSPNENIIVVAEEPIIPVQPVIVEPEAEEDAKQIKHLIKWGDTLWDIAGCYYKNPWAYPRIAKANNIKNPDLIVSGTILIIPR